jgi:YVTN family beta-propeller protein
VGTTPWGVAVNETTNTIYVTNTGSGTVSVISGSTNAVTATITVGSAPWGVSVDPSTNTVYVAIASGTNEVAVINGATNAIITTVAVGTGPEGIATNSTTHVTYVNNFNANTTSVINSPGAVAFQDNGTFETY